MRHWMAGAALALGTSSGACAQTTLTFATHYTDAQMKPLTECFRRYEEQNAGIRIVHRQSTIEDFLQAILTGRISGNNADIYNVYSIWGARLVNAGVLSPPPAETLRFIAEAYEKSTVEAATVGGKVWGIPSEVSTYLLVYNRKLFAKAGIAAPPATWEEVRAAAAKIAEKNAVGKLVVAGYAFGPTVANAVHPLRTLMYSRGWRSFAPDLKASRLDEPAAADVVEGSAALFRDGSASPAIVVRDFPSGTVGMMITANWFKDTLRKGLGDAFAETVGVAPIPGGADWKTYQYSFYQAVDARSRAKDEAWKLLRWLNTAEAGRTRSCQGDMLMALGGLTANRADLAASAADLGDAFSKPYVDALTSGRALSEPNVPQAAEIDRTMRTAIDSVWLGKAAAPAAMAKAKAEVDAILRSPD